MHGGGGGRCHNLKNGKEASENTEEIPAGFFSWNLCIYIYIYLYA